MRFSREAGETGTMPSLTERKVKLIPVILSWQKAEDFNWLLTIFFSSSGQIDSHLTMEGENKRYLFSWVFNQNRTENLT